MKKVLLALTLILALVPRPTFSQPPTIIEQTQRSTVKVETLYIGDEGEQVYFCTGTIVGIIRVLTADHCVPPNYRQIAVNGVLGARIVKRQVDGKAYDGLILLEVPAGLGPIIQVAKQEPKIGDYLVTLGNIDRIGTRVALRRSASGYGVDDANKILGLDGVLVRGMSGGPVINEAGELVGVNQSVVQGLGLTTRLKVIREFLK